MPEATEEEINEVLGEVVKRREIFEELEGESLTKSEASSRLGISKTTAHRAINSLEEKGLLRSNNDGLEITGLGRIVYGEVSELSENVEKAEKLSNFLEESREYGFEVDLGAFEDMNITRPRPGEPYRPVKRFMEIVRGSEELKGIDTTTVAPMYVDEIYEQILDGMEVKVIYDPEIIESIASNYPEKMEEILETGRLQVWVHNDPPFGVAIFDDRVGLGGYDEESGMLRVFADTDSQEAVEWAEKLFEKHRKEAEKIEF